MSRRMLICYAHPDDESFGIGSTIAKYSAEGVEITLICATNGDVGTVSPEKLHGYESVGALRLAELNCAAAILGFKEVITFGYRDSGMMGTEENNHPQSLWQAPLDKVAGQIVEVMRRVRPQVVITFDPFGGYGHPDHIKMHQATHRAMEMIEGDAVRPQKLYYASFPRLLLRIGVTVMRLMGKDPRKMGTNQDLDAVAILDATLPVHARIAVGQYYETGQKAANCHASQTNPRQTFALTNLLFRAMSSRTSFTRVQPPPRVGERIEPDLFLGVRED